MIIKDTIYKKWIYDYKTDDSDEQELLLLDFVEYIFEDNDDNRLSSASYKNGLMGMLLNHSNKWFVELSKTNEAYGYVIGERDLFDTKEECIMTHIERNEKLIDRANREIIECNLEITKLNKLLLDR